MMASDETKPKVAKRPKRKPRRPSVALTTAEKAKIICRCSAGLSVANIARQMGRSPATVRLLRNQFQVISGGNL